MRVLIACEFSGVVRDAFAALGWDAWSCDLLPSEKSGNHHQGDVLDILGEGWDMVIGFPPCTDICISGAKHFAAKRADGRQQRAVDFFLRIANSPAQFVAVENPIGIMSRLWRKPDQIVQPFHFGHEARKPTCLWLKNLPKLKPTNIVSQGEIHITKGGNRLPKWYNLPPSADRWKLRSITFQGIADAMASQWSAYVLSAPPTVNHAPIAENLFAWSARNTTRTAPVSALETPTNSDTMSSKKKENSTEYVTLDPDPYLLALALSKTR